MPNISEIICITILVLFYGLMFYSAYTGLKNAIYKSEIRKKRAKMKLLNGGKK